MNWLPVRGTPADLLSVARPERLWARILHFPLFRLLIVLLFMAPVAVAHNLVAIHILEPMGPPWSALLGDVEKVVNLILFVGAYRLYTRWVEKRSALEVSAAGAAPETALGLAIGAALVLVVTAVMSLAGSYRVAGTGAPTILVHALFLFGMGAFIQELFFRVVVFRLTEALLGTWISVGLVAVLFGALHLGNENATLWTSAALAGSDLLFAGAFVLTRRIWLVWGIHWGWNYLQDGVLGMPNSGVTSLPSWIQPVLGDPAWLTGGSFGIEMSLLGIVLNIAVGLLLILEAVRRGQIVRLRRPLAYGLKPGRAAA